MHPALSSAADVFRAPWRSIGWHDLATLAPVAGIAFGLIFCALVLCMLRGDARERRLGALLVVFMGVGLSFNAKLAGTLWYVRPSADCVNNGNGTAYACAASAGGAGAWRTGASVVYGVSGVDSLDTLKVCNSWVVADADTAFGFLQVDQANAIVDGDCSASGGSAVATMDGGGTHDSAIRCDSPNCVGQTWKNIFAKNFDVKAFYYRNGFTATNPADFTGINLQCQDILGTDANTPACVQGWGVTATVSNSSSVRVTDDAFHWEGAGFSLLNSYCKDPGYGSSTNIGDCVQAAISPAGTRIIGNYFDKSAIVSSTRVTTKQAIAITDVSAATGAVVTDNTVIFSTNGNTTNASKGIYSEIPNALIARNYVVGADQGIFVGGANSTVIGNISTDAESQGINMASTVSSGTHTVANNSVYTPGGTAFNLNGGASVTINATNNLAIGSSIGYTKGGSNTVNQSSNAGFGNTTTSFIGTISVTSDPLLVGGSSPVSPDHFCLTPNSPLRGQGTYIGAWAAGFQNEDLGNPPVIGARGLCDARRATPNRRAVTGGRSP